MADSGRKPSPYPDVPAQPSFPDLERETHIAAGDRCCTYRVGGPTA